MSEKNNVETGKVIGEDEYLLSSLDLKLKDEDITKWIGYQKIWALSNLINATKKKNFWNIDLAMGVKLPNNRSFQKRILKLMKEPEKITHRYINTDTKKVAQKRSKAFKSFL